MKKSHILFCVSFLILYMSHAQINPSWISSGLFPGSGSSTTYNVETDLSGNIIVAGEKPSEILPVGNIFIMKYDPAGNVLWLKAFDYGTFMPWGPYDLCLDNAGNAYITFIKPVTPWTIAVQKYRASDGLLLWTTEIPGGSFNAFEWQVRPEFMTTDGNYVYIAGTKFQEGITGSSMLAVKMNLAGDTIWTRTFKGSGIYANSKSIAVDPSGNVYIAGDAWNTSIDFCVVKFNQNGGLLWHAFLDGSVYHNTDIAQKVVTDGSGNVYLTGYSQISSYQRDILTVKYNQAGTFQWQRSYGNPDYASNNAYYLEIAQDGNLYVGGYVAFQDPYPGTGKDYCLLKYDPSGNLLWDATYDYHNNEDDHPHDFEMGSDGSVYICGTTRKSCYPWEFITTVKFNAQGNLVWDVCIPGLYGTPWEISVSGSDQFVVAAGSYDTIQVKEATTIKYVSASPVDYEANITGIYFSSIIAPPVINTANQTVLAIVHDTANLEYLIPYITISDHACMYPEDEVTTSFVVPVWYNVSSFDGKTEKWWYVTVDGGYVGYEESRMENIQIYPNPTPGKFQLTKNNIKSDSKIRKGINRIELLDFHDKVLGSFNLESGPPDGGWGLDFDITGYPAGVYICRIFFSNSVIVRKIVKF